MINQVQCHIVIVDDMIIYNTDDQNALSFVFIMSSVTLLLLMVVVVITFGCVL